MTARETIENLWDRPIPIATLLDAYAHELAVLIRQTYPSHWLAADLIDPEVNGEY